MWTRGTGPLPPLKFNIQSFDGWQPGFYYFTFVIISLYSLTAFSFVSFFNHYVKMAIFILCLTLKGFICSLHSFINIDILLFHWVYFRSFFNHYTEQNTVFFSFRSSQWEIYKTAVLNQC